ncbi:MAG: hypothetical protein ACJ8G1_03935, partial [Vitreoscilla sp.]
AFKTIDGVPPEAYVGHTIAQMLGQANRDDLAPWITAALAGQDVHFERRGMGQSPDSTFMVSYVPDVDAAGNVDGF